MRIRRVSCGLLAQLLETRLGCAEITVMDTAIRSIDSIEALNRTRFTYILRSPYLKYIKQARIYVNR